VRVRYVPKSRVYGNGYVSVWHMIDRLVLLLSRQRGNTCTVWIRDLIYPMHGNRLNVAVAKAVATQIFPALFPNADWEPVKIEYDVSSGRGYPYNYRIIFRRKARLVPDTVSATLEEVVARGA